LNVREAAPRSLWTAEDLRRFGSGNHRELTRVLGSHPGAGGTQFGVWAPNAEHVSVIGAFNDWDPESDPLAVLNPESGIWEGFVADVGHGTSYKYHVRSRYAGYRADKGDPFAHYWEAPPSTASRIWTLDYAWRDADWMRSRAARNSLDAPWSIYEVHLGSWSRNARSHSAGEDGLGYRELAEPLGDYVRAMGFTHVEFLPLMEHPFYGSWGYQTTGYFAPTARYGTPQDLMYLIDSLHQRGIGVILDWVPSHFPDDLHGLAFFDGTHLYEHADPRRGYHPEWHSHVFNYGRKEVAAFLLSSALFWMKTYHADALRVDAVASMLYLDYARRDGEWLPNESGGRENWEAIEFLRELNTAIYVERPDVQTIAEESTAWPMVSRPVYLDGLGFGMKWNMGWMHDTLAYVSTDPLFRKHQHHLLTFGLWYGFSENFVLPLSHDEVVYGKRSLLGRMPGDEWQQFANLRTLLGYMYAHPGKKLLFMGGEFGQRNEWNHDSGLDWHLLDAPLHAAMRRWVEDLNRFYRSEACLWERDFDPTGFEWIDANDNEQSVLSFIRTDKSGARVVLAIVNFTPVPRPNYQVGVPRGGFWEEVLNSDATEYGGSGQGNLGGLEASPTGSHGRYYSLLMTIPPLSVTLFRNLQTDFAERAG
jgi:1,4-alpha-glucan branching enzyme